MIPWPRRVASCPVAELQPVLPDVENRRTMDRSSSPRGVACACTVAAGLLLATRTGEAAEPTQHVVVAGAASDTLAFGLDEVLPVAISELEKDDWTIQRADSAAGSHRLVTRWKPLKHALARVLLDGVMARCVIDLVPTGGDRTVVTIQGGLTSRDDLENSPAFPIAQTTYRQAAERWLSRVELSLETRERR
jgi:hypothetical protein